MDDLPDLRLCHDNDPGNKLNGLIENVPNIGPRRRHNTYTNPATGEQYPLTGAAQMIFSDLGTEAAAEKRGFSAYTWIRQRLIALGVPAEQIAIMQNFKKSEHKQRLFNAVNSGRVRILLGSSQTMGTGVNAQQRLIAEHHLDVPWLPSDIEQREGRIIRQGNQNAEIQIYAYATRGSMDATMWQTVERKMRFINAVLRGDKSIRRLEDLEADQVNQFAMAKAMASGDDRLLTKAGLQMEIDKLKRQRSAHYDSQMMVRRRIDNARADIVAQSKRIEWCWEDIAARQMPAAETFTIKVEGEEYTEREKGVEALMKAVNMATSFVTGNRTWAIAEFGGFQDRRGGVAGKQASVYGKVGRIRMDIRRAGNRFTKVFTKT